MAETVVVAGRPETSKTAARVPAHGGRSPLEPRPAARYGLRIAAIAYVGVLVLLPLATVFWHTFSGGIAPVVEALTQPDVVHAFVLTIEVAVISVIANTVFGVGMAMLLVRYRFWGRRAISALIDLPVAMSPVVVGVAIVLAYGANTPIGSALSSAGFQVVYALPGMVLATVFVSLPLVLREVVPVLEEAGIEQDQAAQSLGAGAWQRFVRITLPTIKWGVAYGVVLSIARCMGEFGAVKIVSGNLLNQTQTATLVVEQKYQDFDQAGAYAMSFVLVAIAVVCILTVSLLRPEEGGR